MEGNAGQGEKTDAKTIDSINAIPKICKGMYRIRNEAVRKELGSEVK
jgi:hypothetical protein